MDDLQLHKYGPWAVVTGASDGIGRAFARELAARGFQLVLVARRESELRELSLELSKSHGTHCLVHAGDLACEDFVHDLHARTADFDIGLLVASAGTGYAGDFLSTDLGDAARILDVHCRAVLQQSLHFGRRFERRGSGGLVLLSSALACHGIPNSANYAACKAYVQSLAEALHVEWKTRGIDVIAVAPGPVHSGFAASAGMRYDRAESPVVVVRDTLAAIGRVATVRPGLLAKAIALGTSLLPRMVSVGMMGQVIRDITIQTTSRSTG